jgi:hypothetical protein
MRTVLERYVADRDSLARFDATPLSTAVRERMAGFYG